MNYKLFIKDFSIHIYNQQNLKRMGNSLFKPEQINLVTFSPDKILTLQNNKQLNQYIKRKFCKNKLQKNPYYKTRDDWIWMFTVRDLSFQNMKILFQSLKQVKFQRIYLKALQDYEVNHIVEPFKDLQRIQVDIIKSLNFSTYGELQLLSLSDCSIKSIEGLSFLNAPNLTHLDISYNPFCNFKPFNKCNFVKLTDLRTRNNYTAQTSFLSKLRRCNLTQQIQQIFLDDDYINTTSALYNPVQKPQQSFDLSPMFKWNCLDIYDISIRQSKNVRYIKTIKYSKLESLDKIKQKYTSINMRIYFR